MTFFGALGVGWIYDKIGDMFQIGGTTTVILKTVIIRKNDARVNS